MPTKNLTTVVAERGPSDDSPLVAAGAAGTDTHATPIEVVDPEWLWPTATEVLPDADSEPAADASDAGDVAPAVAAAADDADDGEPVLTYRRKRSVRGSPPALHVKSKSLSVDAGHTSRRKLSKGAAGADVLNRVNPLSPRRRDSNCSAVGAPEDDVPAQSRRRRSTSGNASMLTVSSADAPRSPRRKLSGGSIGTGAAAKAGLPLSPRRKSSGSSDGSSGGPGDSSSYMGLSPPDPVDSISRRLRNPPAGPRRRRSFATGPKQSVVTVHAERRRSYSDPLSRGIGDIRERRTVANDLRELKSEFNAIGSHMETETRKRRASFSNGPRVEPMVYDEASSVAAALAREVAAATRSTATAAAIAASTAEAAAAAAAKEAAKAAKLLEAVEEAVSASSANAGATATSRPPLPPC